MVLRPVVRLAPSIDHVVGYRVRYGTYQRQYARSPAASAGEPVFSLKSWRYSVANHLDFLYGKMTYQCARIVKKILSLSLLVIIIYVYALNVFFNYHGRVVTQPFDLLITNNIIGLIVPENGPNLYQQLLGLFKIPSMSNNIELC